MNIVRFAARSALAGIFLVEGVKAVRDPDRLVESAAPLTDRIAPALQRVAPPQVAGYIPEDTRSLVQANGVIQVVGGLALASGIGRRLGSGALAASMLPTMIASHPFWSIKHDPDARAEARLHFLQNLSILGGLVIAAGDTQGDPSLRWRARHGVASAKKSSERTLKSARKSSGRTLRTARREAKLAGRAAKAELPFS